MNIPHNPIITLGIAASNSMMKDRGVLNFSGASSERYIAIPRLNGTAMSRARNDETRVPKIKGREPNTSFTGSQVDVARKLKPKVFLESSDPIISSLNKRNARINIQRANNPTTALKIKSPENFLRPRRIKDNFVPSI